MFSLRKVAFSVSNVRNRSMRAVSEVREVVSTRMLDSNTCEKKVATTEANFDKRFTTIEGFQGTEKHISIADARQILEEAVEYSIHGPSIQGIQGGHDELADLEVVDTHSETDKSLNINNELPENVSTYSCSRNINLHGCMQTNVPTPYSVQSEISSVQLNHGSPQNMPGNGKKLFQKYISGGRNDIVNSQQKRSFYVGTTQFSQASYAFQPDAPIDDPTPQGIQGDECIQNRLWMETCLRYGLANCNEQYQSIQSGRKTLAQVFAEQEEIIRNVAESYRRGLTANQQESSGAIDLMDISTPEGIQGDDCVQFQLWLKNCNRFGIQEHCIENLQKLKTGRKTLADIFAEQERIIKSAVQQYQQKRHYSTTKSAQENQEVGSNSPESQPQNPEETPKNSRAKLRKAIAEYGSTVIVFHVGISLISLGGFYLLVSSGIDVVGLLMKAGIGESILQSRLAAGASTFVIAYAVHKVFAPVRIGITLTATPFIVQYLRRVGFLKSTPKP